MRCLGSERSGRLTRRTLRPGLCGSPDPVLHAVVSSPLGDVSMDLGFTLGGPRAWGPEGAHLPPPGQAAFPGLVLSRNSRGQRVYLRGRSRRHGLGQVGREGASLELTLILARVGGMFTSACPSLLAWASTSTSLRPKQRAIGARGLEDPPRAPPLPPASGSHERCP